MRKIILSLHTSLDGFAAGPNGEMDWIKLDDELFDLVESYTAEADTALYGRVTWEMMDSYWPTAAAQPGATKHDRVHAEWYGKVDKIVLSKSMQGKQVAKTRFISDDVTGEISKLKQQPGASIIIFGSASVAHTLMEHNLVDEFRLFVNPVLLGEGIPVFDKIRNRTNVKLQDSKLFSCGVIALHYTLEKQ